MFSQEAGAVCPEPNTTTWNSNSPDSLTEQLVALRTQMVDLERETSCRIDPIPHARRQSARNLLHYVALRRHDIRPLQEALVTQGLSSLGRCEAFVMENIDAVLRVLGQIEADQGLLSRTAPPNDEPTDAISFRSARRLLRQRAEQLFGVGSTVPAIMVTMPTEAASDYAFVRDLVHSGMVVMRINCAHDDASTWQRMIENLRRAEAELGKPCRVAMDLAGPKIRTGRLGKKLDAITLHRSDRLLLTSDATRARAAKRDPAGHVISPPEVGCSLPQVFADVRPGHRLLLDDGKIATEVTEVCENHLVLEVTRAKNKGSRLKANKGINLPDSELDLPALTEKDLSDLEFIAEHSDIVSYSFIRRPEDIRRLHQELDRIGHPDLSVILKIENSQSFSNLPLLLLEALRYFPNTGVMVARGDLAVECGWERLVEVQEEILWMCEAAHIPVVWATQVLEGLAKKGLPTRAELTDAGAGSRAECVMLNKGPNIVEAVNCLHDILSRMQEHQAKKRPTFRRLRVAERVFGESND